MTPAGAAALDPGASARIEQRFSLREAARILDLPEARLRALARAGLLAPQRGPHGPLSFGFRDLLLLRTTQSLLDSGVPMRRIRAVWASLRDQLAAGKPLTGISIRSDGDQVVATDGTSSWRPDSGQTVLDFESAGVAVPAPPDVDPAPVTGAAPPVLSLVPGFAATEPRAVTFTALDEAPVRPAVEGELTAEQWYDLAVELEGSSPLEAIAAYQQALELDPGIADAHVNLGRLYQLTGERGRAEAQYRDAVRLSPEDPVPHFNLGVLLEELGRRDEAAHAYGQAVSRDPEFADAHCNLGLLLEAMGRRQEAMRHLMTARELYRTTE